MFEERRTEAFESRRSDLAARFDAVLLATGAQRQRTLDLPGAGLAGVEPAMDYLIQQNRRVAGRPAGRRPITAAGKDVRDPGWGRHQRRLPRLRAA